MEPVAPTRRTARFSSGFDSRVNELAFGNDVILDGSTIVSGLVDAIPAVGADLLEIATVAYAVDRILPRPTEREAEKSGGWGREIWVEVPVREPVLWHSHAGSLSALLHWLTDDQWKFDFVQLDVGHGPLDVKQGVLFDTLPSGIPPVLFSGGLDSACGLYLDLLRHDAIAVSVHTNTWMHHVQRQVSHGLSSRTSHSVVPLRYRVCLPRASSESSQRTRGFLFLSAGVSAALALRCNKVSVSENGIGSINLPYLRSQEGAQATRSMHPRTLGLMESLATKVIGHTFQISAPYRTITKAELLAQIPREADSILARTVSCDTAFAARVKDHSPCGRCTSCLLRRQAIYGAGRNSLDDHVSYRYPAADTVALSAMLWQVLRLRECLSASLPWLGLVEDFPEIEFARHYMTAEEIIRLYKCYVDEWDLFMEAVPIDEAWRLGRMVG
jgi:Predicted PP-loop superfamily ATPase